ncbi:hypothetical protein C0992_009872, partial [Termitomyces sp. T32_za158]
MEIYRHNELDLPGITQPLMYEQISARRSVPQIYEEKLKSEGMIDDQTITSIREFHKVYLEAELARTPSYKPDAAVLRDQWAGMVWSGSAEAVCEPETGVGVETLRRVGSASVHVPKDF